MISQRPQLWFSLTDASDSIGNMSMWLADGVTVVTAAAAAATFRDAVEPCTDAVFTKQSIVYPAVESPQPDASAGADATRVGVLIFSDDSGNFGIIELPGIPDSALMSTGAGAGLLIDRDNPAIAALIAELIAGIWCNPFGYPLVTLEAAFLQIRR